jgi:hypothetical protein
MSLRRRRDREPRVVVRGSRPARRRWPTHGLPPERPDVNHAGVGQIDGGTNGADRGHKPDRPSTPRCTSSIPSRPE